MPSQSVKGLTCWMFLGSSDGTTRAWGASWAVQIIEYWEHKSAPGPAVTSITPDLKQVKTLAKCYTALWEPFSTIYNNLNLFSLPWPLAEALNPTLRFGTNKAACWDGWLAQLYSFLLPRFHSMVREHSGFDTEVSSVLMLVSSFWILASQFHGGAKSMHSALIDRSCKASPTIFNLPPEIFKPNYKWEKESELTQLLKWDSNLKCPLNLPPVLYPPSVWCKGHKGFETKLFQSPEIFQVSRQMWSQQFLSLLMNDNY